MSQEPEFQVLRDEVRGHFVMVLPPHGAIKREVVGAELGATLHLTMSGAHLTPDEARALAQTLTWWADRKHADDTSDLDRLVEINDLFDLIPAEEGR